MYNVFVVINNSDEASGSESVVYPKIIDIIRLFNENTYKGVLSSTRYFRTLDQRFNVHTFFGKNCLHIVYEIFTSGTTQSVQSFQSSKTFGSGSFASKINEVLESDTSIYQNKETLHIKNASYFYIFDNVISEHDLDHKYETFCSNFKYFVLLESLSKPSKTLQFIEGFNTKIVKFLNKNFKTSGTDETTTIQEFLYKTKIDLIREYLKMKVNENKNVFRSFASGTEGFKIEDSGEMECPNF